MEVLSMKKGNWVVFLPFYLLAAILMIGISQGGSWAVTEAVQAIAEEDRITVLIDPGHGGVDGGATSCTGILESGLNLEISMRLRDLLTLMGCKTKMVRTTDTSVATTGQTIAETKISDLKERVRMANEQPNTLLVSIHQNTFSDSRYGGAQVFYAQTEGSKELAALMQSTFAATVNPGSNRKCKPADGIYLMQQVKCPGVLVECGFLSNPAEEAKLRNSEYQKQICCVIAACVTQSLQA